jgi:hypothetical protein
VHGRADLLGQEASGLLPEPGVLHPSAEANVKVVVAGGGHSGVTHHGIDDGPGDRLALALLEGRFREGDTVAVDAVDGEIVLGAASRAAAAV